MLQNNFYNIACFVRVGDIKQSNESKIRYVSQILYKAEKYFWDNYKAITSKPMVENSKIENSFCSLICTHESKEVITEKFKEYLNKEGGLFSSFYTITLEVDKMSLMIDEALVSKF